MKRFFFLVTLLLLPSIVHGGATATPTATAIFKNSTTLQQLGSGPDGTLLYKGKQIVSGSGGGSVTTQNLTFAAGDNMTVTGDDATKTLTFKVYSSPVFHDVASKGPGADVRAYGAVDNADIAPAITAILAANASKSSVTIVLPAGHTYTGNITINRSNVEITGGGTLKGTIYVIGTSGAKITGTNIHGIRIVRDSITTGNNGIELAWYDGAEISNNYFSNLDNTIYIQQIDTSTFQPNGKLNIHDNYTAMSNIDLNIDSFKNDWTTVTGDTHYVNNIAICNNYHIHALSADGLVVTSNTWFFPATQPAKKNNIYVNYYDQTIIANNNAFEAGEEAFILGHGSRANIGNNNFIWPGQYKASSAVKIWGGDHDGTAYTFANIHDNFAMWPTLHGYEADAASGYITFKGNEVWGPGKTDHYKGAENLVSMTHNYINVDSTTDFVVSEMNTGGGTTGAIFNVVGSKQFTLGDHYRLSDGTVVMTGAKGKKILTLSGTETSITTDGLFGVHLNQSAPTTITTISAGTTDNQELFIFAYNGNTTIKNNSGIKLGNATDATLSTYNALTLVWNAGSNWWEEKSRNFPLRGVVLTLSGTETTFGVANTTDIYCNQSGATTVTSITGGYAQQTIVLYGWNGNTTLQHNSTIKLKGGVNATIPQYGSLTLEYNSTASLWFERARSF